MLWAIVDADNKEYISDSVLDYDSPANIEEQLLDGTYDLDHRMRRAFLEVVRQGKIPGPDRLMKVDCEVDKKKLSLNYEGNTFEKKGKNYHIHCENPDLKNNFTLTLTPKKKPIRQGHNGVVKVGLKGDTMMYYFIPRCEAKGTVTIRGEKYTVTGNGWYDHEFGGEVRPHKKIPKAHKPAPTATAAAKKGKGSAKGKSKSKSKAKGKGKKKDSDDEEEEADEDDKKVEVKAETKEVKESKAVSTADDDNVPVKKEDSYAWNWLSCQLDDGTDISATQLVQPKTKVLYDNYAVVVGKDSERNEYGDAALLGVENWSSTRTAQDYPTLWELQVPSAEINLLFRAAFPEQEFMTLISKPALWEGRLDVAGTIKGKKVKGLGFIERHGFQAIDSLDKFFKRISTQVKGEIEKVLPLEPNDEQALLLCAATEYPHFLHGGNKQVFVDKVIRPIREVVDRGGKSWRSFAFLLCIDAVGGFSPLYKHWLAMPEIMHVGSLIVDDIQDKSETRRGGPSCHKTYGEAIAINAGTAAYFLSMHILYERTPSLTPETRLKMYDMYMLTLRAGHAGQAFDINGLDYMMDDIVDGKVDGQVLIDRVTCTHRLKSAVPAGNLARMGAQVAGADIKKIEALGRYFEAIGVAFQIIGMN
jgi:predicted secreted hydrolase